MREQAYGPISEGRTTTVLPQISGSATEMIRSGIGAFHGITAYLDSGQHPGVRAVGESTHTTPRARRCMNTCPPGIMLGSVSPFSSFTRHAKSTMMSDALLILKMTCDSG